ncbi:hypothetical protein BCR35DRAFT_350750 [Leucosporidium creatinivorum]|uniref:BTB domain-containing protein n=1 Tax=Leucosporidium creatinivorum TaxID=106004 RepID=A0A1Y2FXT7_9BASI|nr:hypothetical protein BCR35DRAFT_350750 [Leucosporidium creatinivorum]
MPSESTPFIVTHDTTAGKESSTELHLPFPPFNSGKWELVVKPSGSYFSAVLRWKGCISTPTVLTVDLAVLDRQRYLSNNQICSRSVVQAGVFPSQPDGKVATEAAAVRADYSERQLRVQLSIRLGTRSAPSATTMASSVSAHLAARHPNDVRLYFPLCERELWANSAFLAEKSPYFKDLFASGFAEGSLRTESTRLEKDDDGAWRMSTFDDSDDETDTVPPSSSPIKTEGDVTSSSSPVKSEAGCGSPFREIIITETAFTTYRALLVYLQTAHIDFAPLLSSFNADISFPPAATRRKMKITTRRLDGMSLPLPASPKSIYRLAHLLSLPDLSAQALAALSSQLTPSNVLYELFDSVSGTYDEVQQVELEYAIKHWKEVKCSASMFLMESRAQSGKLSHPVGMLLKLAKSLS